jgi:hypothetical protein
MASVLFLQWDGQRGALKDIVVAIIVTKMRSIALRMRL